MTIQNIEKTGSRGHPYSDKGPCPACWPGYYERQISPKEKQKTKRKKGHG